MARPIEVATTQLFMRRRFLDYARNDQRNRQQYGSKFPKWTKRVADYRLPAGSPAVRTKKDSHPLGVAVLNYLADS